VGVHNLYVPTVDDLFEYKRKIDSLNDLIDPVKLTLPIESPRNLLNTRSKLTQKLHNQKKKRFFSLDLQSKKKRI